MRASVITTTLLTILLSTHAFAVPISCQQLDGTWYGTYADASKLFYDGGPFAIVLQIKQQGKHFIGRVISNPTVPPKRDYLWGKCQAGKITQLYFAKNAKQCGTTSHGELAAKDKLTIAYNWQNPTGMNGDQFVMKLHKGPSIALKTIPKFLSGTKLPLLQSCL